MPQVLDTFPARPGHTRHPWSQWLDGRVWQLTPGDDFEAKIATIKQSAKSQALRRGGDVRMSVFKRDGREHLVLQFIRN
jgi:hypothetical protein